MWHLQALLWPRNLIHHQCPRHKILLSASFHSSKWSLKLFSVPSLSGWLELKHLQEEAAEQGWWFVFGNYQIASPGLWHPQRLPGSGLGAPRAAGCWCSSALGAESSPCTGHHTPALQGWANTKIHVLAVISSDQFAVSLSRERSSQNSNKLKKGHIIFYTSAWSRLPRIQKFIYISKKSCCVCQWEFRASVVFCPAKCIERCCQRSRYLWLMRN